MVRSMYLRRRVARCGASVADHVKSFDIRSNRRHCGRGHNFHSRGDWRVRNWDYRFCWLRDATFTLYALIIGGYTQEAEAWRHWLINAVAGTPADINIMYGLAGERRLTEINLEWLRGYENSKPVRTGNAAYAQHQLDVYGEVMDSLHVARRHGINA